MALAPTMCRPTELSMLPNPLPYRNSQQYILDHDTGGSPTKGHGTKGHWTKGHRQKATETKGNGTKGHRT